MAFLIPHSKLSDERLTKRLHRLMEKSEKVRREKKAIQDELNNRSK